MFLDLINIFFPKTCAGCHNILLSAENVICTDCRHNIPLTNHLLNLENNEIHKKLYGRVDLKIGFALMYFHKHNLVREIIHSLKYRGNQEVGLVLGNWIANELKNKDVIKDIDYILPVPIHKKRKRKRGYNQVAVLGTTLAENLNIVYDENFLYRKTYLKSQTKLSFDKRNQLKENTFEVNFDETHTGKHFLIIDDVFTTGATMEACAKAIQKIPNSKISVLCLAVTI